MRSTIAIEVAAPADLVFDLAHRVERWPDLLPHYRRVRVRERHADGALTAEMLAIRAVVPLVGFGIPVAWRSRTWSERESRRLRFVHHGGPTDGMDVTWRIEPTASGCRVSIEHDFNPRSRFWGLLVNQFFVHPIATRTLATFRAIAEAVAASVAAREERSEPGPTSNTPT